MSATGRPKRECRSAQRGGNPTGATGRPKRSALEGAARKVVP